MASWRGCLAAGAVLRGALPDAAAQPLGARRPGTTRALRPVPGAARCTGGRGYASPANDRMAMTTTTTPMM